jgi:hypothetical protein
MADEPINLVLEHLRAIRAELAGLREDVGELKLRQSETHRAVLSVRRDQVSDAETVAHVEARMDKLVDRVARIERRLDIAE